MKRKSGHNGRRVSVNSFSDALRDLLREYGEEVNDACREVVGEVAKETAKELRDTSPRRPGGGEYAKSWTYKPVKVNGLLTEYVVYSKAPHYRLTHLLENKRVVANQYGTYGTREGTPHIKTAEERAIERVEKKLREAIEK